MAIMGIVEFVEVESHIEVCLRDKTLANSMNNNFVNGNGKPAAGREFWEQLLALVKEKRITLTATLAEKLDPQMCNVADRASTAAQEALDSFIRARITEMARRCS